MPIAIYHRIKDFQPDWIESHPELVLTRSVKQTTALMTNPIAAIAIHYRHGITKDYLPFIRAATSARVKHMLVIIDNIKGISHYDYEEKEDYLDSLSVEYLDAAALEARRLFQDLLGMNVKVFCNYAGTEKFPTLSELVELPKLPDSDSLNLWLDSVDDNSKSLKPFLGQVYASRRTAENTFVGKVVSFAGDMTSSDAPLLLHTASGVRAVKSAVKSSATEVISDARMHTGDIVAESEIPYARELRGTLSLKAREFGGPVRQIFNDADLGFALGALGTHGSIKLPLGIGKILPGAIQTGVRVALHKALPFSIGDNLIVFIASREGKRYCGSFEVTEAR